MRSLHVKFTRSGLGTALQRRRCRTAVSSFETQRGLDEDTAPLDQDTIKHLVDMGMSQAEAEAEAAWDPTETDPRSNEFAFDDIYSVDDELPSDMREELMRPGYGPSAIIAAGFRLEEYAVIRCTLDAVGATHLKLLIAEEKLLHSNLDTALAMEEIDWQQPRPPAWIQGGAWGTKRVILFSGLSVAQQGALVEVLEGHGIDNIAVCANAPEASTRIVGEVLAQAVQAAPRKPRATPSPPPSSGAATQPVPRWAEDADPAHVAPGGLPKIADELRGRMKTVSDHVAQAESVGDIDLSTGLSEEDRARREAFLQDLMPQERVAEYVREAAAEEQRAARAAQREMQEEREWAAHGAATEAPEEDAATDPVAGAVAEAVAAVSGDGGDRGGVAVAPPPMERRTDAAADSASTGVKMEPPVAAVQDEKSATSGPPVAEGVGQVDAVSARAAVAPAAVPEAVRAEIVREDRGAELESQHKGMTIDTSAENVAVEVDDAQPRESARAGMRARRRRRNAGAAAPSGGANEVGLDDLIADEAAGTGLDDTGFVDTWLHGSSGGGVVAERGHAPAAGGTGVGGSHRVAAGVAAGVAPHGALAEDVTMDAISRALKSGVDKETLKRYIDEVAEQVADSAGSWLKDIPPDDGVPGSNTEAAAQLGNALRGSQGMPLQHGPQAPPQRGWDMREEVKAENAARAAAGAPHATKVAPPATPAGEAGGAAAAPAAVPVGAAAGQEDARYTDDTPYVPRASMGHFDPMQGNGADDGGLETADAVRALASGLGMGAGEDGEEFPWLEEDLGTGPGGASAATATPAKVDGGVWDMSGEAAGSADDYRVPGWKFDGFEGMESVRNAAAASGGDPDPRTDAPQQVDESDIDEQVGAAQPATLEQLQMAAERHGLDLEELLADARRRGVQIDGA